MYQLKPALLPLRMAMLLLLEIAHIFTVVATKKELFLLRMVLLLLLLSVALRSSANYPLLFISIENL